MLAPDQKIGLLECSETCDRSQGQTLLEIRHPGGEDGLIMENIIQGEDEGRYWLYMGVCSSPISTSCTV